MVETADQFDKGYGDSTEYKKAKYAMYRPFEASATFTRPADTTPYGQYDAVSNSTSAPTIMTFADVGSVVGEDVSITEAIVISSAAAALPNFRLWLLNASVAATNDNSKLDISDANSTKVVAIIKIEDAYQTNSNSRAESANLAKQVGLASDSKTLYGLLQTDEAYTPASGEVFTVILRGYRMA